MLSIDEIDTSKFIYDPKAKGFVEEMQKEEMFDFRMKPTRPVLTEKAALTYICLMYDLNSKFLEKELDIIKRKEIVGKMCGFPYTDEEGFSKYAIELMSGQVPVFNDALTHYLYLSNSIFLQRLASLEYNYEKEIRKSFDEYDGKKHDLLDKELAGIVKMREKIFGGHESHELHKALSKKLRKISQQLRIEQVNEELKINPVLAGYSPYFDGYMPGEPKYEGDSIPG